MTPRKPRTGSGRQNGAPTIADVAALAGVSTMTVSRVINAESNVRDSTRETVNAAIGQLNYAPNRAARSLAGASHLRLGLLYSNPSAAYLSEFLVGSLDQAGRSDIQLVVEKCELGDHERRVVERMINGGIDGVILPPPLCDSRSVLDVLIAARVPTVVVATGCPPAECAAISIDDRGAAQEMTRHLIDLGHARIGFIAGNPNLTASGQRLEGYRAALAAAGMPFDEQLVADGLFTYRSGLDAADELLERDNPPSAIFASNDDMAAAIISVAHRRQLDVPRALTVVGFDDTTTAVTLWPPLTTVHQPVRQLAVEALGLLVTQIAGGGAKPSQLVLKHDIVKRQSTSGPERKLIAEPKRKAAAAV